jgi:hypothetical protein
MLCLMREMTDSPLSAASMSPLGNGEGEVCPAYDSMRARLAALGNSSSAGVPFGAIVSCSHGTGQADDDVCLSPAHALETHKHVLSAASYRI